MRGAWIIPVSLLAVLVLLIGMGAGTCGENGDESGAPPPGGGEEAEPTPEQPSDGTKEWTCMEWGSPYFIVQWDGQSESVDSLNQTLNLGTVSPSTEISIEGNYNCVSPYDAEYEWQITPLIVGEPFEQFACPSPLTYCPQNGWKEATYHVHVHAVCGANGCSTYYFNIQVEAVEACQCGQWIDTNEDGAPDVTVEGEIVNFEETITITTASLPVTIEPGYECQGACGPVTYDWQVVGPGGFSSSAQDIAAPIELSQQNEGLNGTGEYTVYLEAHCNGQECPDAFEFTLVIVNIDFSFTRIPVGGSGDPGGPGGYCPGEIFTYQYELTNGSPYDLSYDFSNSNPSTISYDPSSGTVVNGGEQTILIHYQMPGSYDQPCTQGSYTFSHNLNITLHTNQGPVKCAPIEHSFLINCHSCPPITCCGNIPGLFSSGDMEMQDANDHWVAIRTIFFDKADVAWNPYFGKLDNQLHGECGAEWVHGNSDWLNPQGAVDENYRLEFTIPAGQCYYVAFTACVDGAASFRLKPPSGSGVETEFFNTTEYSNQPGSYRNFYAYYEDQQGEPEFCLPSGNYTLLVDHWDIDGPPYGLIFAATRCPTCWRDLILKDVVFDNACNAKFTICNKGNADATGNFEFTVSPIEDPSGQTTVWSTPIDGLAAGECVTLEWSDVRVFGTTIDVTVDPQNSVAECDETNNETSFSVPDPCQKEPDMIVPSNTSNTYFCDGDPAVVEVTNPPLLSIWTNQLQTEYGAQWLWDNTQGVVNYEIRPCYASDMLCTTFEIPQGCVVSFAVLKISADDEAPNIELNGNYIGEHVDPSDHSACDEVSSHNIDPGYFVPGLNTLSVEVKDQGCNYQGGTWCLIIYFQ